MGKQSPNKIRFTNRKGQTVTMKKKTYKTPKVRRTA